MKACLVLIDVQESFRQRPYFTEADVPAYLAAQNALIAACQERGVPIVRIFHVEGPKTAQNAFAVESGFVRPFEGLTPVEPAVMFHKTRHSALVGTGLDVWLTQQGISRLIISGIRTEQCCETTTRHASDLGFEVDYVTDATLTFDMQLADGSPLRAADIKARTAAVLKDRFARICSVPQAIDRIATSAMAA
jgi:nicotinamidase-related amidase